MVRSQFLPSSNSGTFWWLLLCFLIDRSLILLDYKGSTNQLLQKLLRFRSSIENHNFEQCALENLFNDPCFVQLIIVFHLYSLWPCPAVFRKCPPLTSQSSSSSLSRYWSWSDFENWHDGGVPFIFGQVYLGGCYCHKIIRGRTTIGYYTILTDFHP